MRSGTLARRIVPWFAATAALLRILLVLLGPSASELGPSQADRTIVVLAAVAMGMVLGTAVLRPWTGLVLWIAVMPILDVARVRPPARISISRIGS